MNPEPEPCSTCGRRRNWGKKSSKPGGRRWLSARSTCCALMNTTAGFTWSAMDTKASPKSATAFGTTTGGGGPPPGAPRGGGGGGGGGGAGGHRLRQAARLGQTERGGKRQAENEGNRHQRPELEPVPCAYRHRR